jgi:WD40 repeat protein
MPPPATGSHVLALGLFAALAAILAVGLAPAGDTKLPTADEVKALQQAYRAERDAAVKSGAKDRFLPEFFANAEQIAKRGDAALDAGRLLQATEAFRQARWQLPYQGPQFPDHVAHVFGSLRLRHANEALAAAFSPDGKWLATAGRDRTVKVWDMANGHEAVTYRGHQRYVRHVAFSPDGKWVATAGGDRDVRIWDPATGKEIRTLKGEGQYVTAMAVSPDGKYVLAAGDDRDLRVYDAATGEVKQTVEFRLFGGLRSLAFSPDGKRLATGAENGQVRLYIYPDFVSAGAPEYWSQQDNEGSSNFLVFSPDSKQLLRSGPDAVKVYDVPQPGGGAGGPGPRLTLVPPEDPKNKSKIHTFTCAAWNRDGRTLYTGCTDGIIRLYDVIGGQPSGTFKGHNGSVTALVFNGAGTQLASASTDYTVRLWNFDIVLQARDFAGHTEPVWAADFSPDGQRLASCGADRTCRVWDVGTGKALKVFDAHTAGLTSVRFSNDGKSLVVCGGDKLLRIQDAETGKVLQTFTGHSGTVTAAAFNHDGTRVVSGSADNAVIVWEAATGKQLATIDTGSLVMAVTFTPDGKQVVAGCVDRHVRFYNADGGKPGAAWVAHNHAVSNLAFDGKGEQLATCGFDNLVKVWPMATPGQNPAVLTGHTGPLSAVAFRLDGNYLVSGGNDHVVRLWKREADGWKESQLFRGHTDWVTCLTFSRNGYFILSASADRTLKIWELASRELPLTAEHTGAVECVAVSPNGKLMASGATDRTIKLWDLKTGAEVLTIRGTGDTVVALAFSPDSKTLYSSGEDRNLRRWEVASGKELPPVEHQQNVTNFIKAVPQIGVRPDGKRLIAWVPFDERGTRVSYFEPGSGNEFVQLNDRGKDVRAVAWSRDFKLVAFGAKDGNVRVYNVGDEVLDKKPSDFKPLPKDVGVSALVMAPDAGYLAIGAENGTVLLLDPVTGKVGKTLDGHKKAVTALATSGDGGRLATAGMDNVVVLWDSGGKELRRWTMPPLTADRGFVTQLTFTSDGRFVVTANANSTLFLLELP